MSFYYNAPYLLTNLYLMANKMKLSDFVLHLPSLPKNLKTKFLIIIAKQTQV